MYILYICIAIIQHVQFSDTEALYPNFGYLYPEGTKELRKVFNDTTVRAALEPYSKYLQLFDQVGRLSQVLWHVFSWAKHVDEEWWRWTVYLYMCIHTCIYIII